VADAYLFTILNWSMATPVDLTRWPGLAEYRARLGQRPSVARSFQEELALYRLERARHAHDELATSLLDESHTSAALSCPRELRSRPSEVNSAGPHPRVCGPSPKRP